MWIMFNVSSALFLTQGLYTTTLKLRLVQSIDMRKLRPFACGRWNETLGVTQTDLHFIRAGYVCRVQ